MWARKCYEARLSFCLLVYLPLCSLALTSLAPGLRAQGTAKPPDQQVSAPVGDPLQDAEDRADAMMAQKLYSDALAAYKALLVKQPQSAGLQNKIGIAYHHLLKFSDAKRYYQLALRTDPTLASAANNIGTIYYQQKKYKKAIKEYQHAIKIGPELASFDSNLGYAFFGDKQYDPAMLAFRRALQLDPTVFERHSLTGTSLMERSVEDRGLFFFFLAKSYAQMGNAERCAQYLRKARDEGFNKMATVKTDPAFASVRDNPLVKQVLENLPSYSKPNSSS